MTARKIRQIRNRIQNPNKGFRHLFDQFIHSQSIGGILLLVCSAIAIITANIPALNPLHDIWDYPFRIEIGAFFNKEMPLSLWINDGLMAIFFLTVGLEIKREIVAGELSSFKHAALPIFAAIGGMIVPALIFTSFNYGTPTQSGWGIPMATDIAFAIGIMSLLGKRVPLALKVFLTALAIVDDLGAIIVLAIFYPTHIIHTDILAWSGMVFGLLLLLNIFRVQRVMPYVILGIILWVLMLHSGVHATIAGVILAMTIPIKTRINEVRFYTNSKYFLEKFKIAGHSGLNVISNPQQLDIIQKLDSQINCISPLTHRFESALYGIVTFFIMPIFALANAGVVIDVQAIQSVFMPLPFGIFFGLLLGKPIGITLFSWMAVKLKLAVLPQNTKWIQVLALGVAAGIGFTMSIFIDNLAFQDQNLINLGKIAVLITSITAGIFGYTFLRLVTKKPINKRVYKSKKQKEMKTVKSLLFISALLILTAESCAQKKNVEGVSAAQIDSVSYALGMDLGKSFVQAKLEGIDLNVMSKAITDVFNDKELRFDEAQAQMIIRNFMTQRQEMEKIKNQQEGEKFLENNKKDLDVITLPSGMQYKIITEGTGKKPIAEDTVVVNYRGTLIDGREFDSSYENGQPAEFPLNRVIPGWTEGIQQLQEGAKAMLYIPSDLAYGDRPMPGSIIGPGSTLIFEVELLEVKPAK